VGIKIGQYYQNASKKVVINQLLDSLSSGKLRILSKDALGNFLDCNHKKIPLDSLKSKWDTKKCLIPSNH
tara:strand:+ start:112467 stop:112676 length:210 start_codon:yes stop_codon:yes gene_type:complete